MMIQEAGKGLRESIKRPEGRIKMSRERGKNPVLLSLELIKVMIIVMMVSQTEFNTISRDKRLIRRFRCQDCVG